MKDKERIKLIIENWATDQIRDRLHDYCSWDGYIDEGDLTLEDFEYIASNVNVNDITVTFNNE